jgi:hypothetical protein
MNRFRRVAGQRPMSGRAYRTGRIYPGKHQIVVPAGHKALVIFFLLSYLAFLVN